ncbi:diguanylate cyclase [Herbaspirillum sp. GCM10030257]|uniref:GGDEF domain-containing protein n=1 Tax=Herbaspirillum sp. GCM10030257 TaxID=3273393 RepID=UPI0036140324
MRSTSLRRQLVLPYVLLVVFVSTAVALVSYRAGEDAVQELTRRVVTDMVDRIGSATEKHLAGALTALNAVDPDSRMLPRPQPFDDSIPSLEPRLWMASGLFIDASNYVYFGGVDGRFIGVNRISRDFVELYLREPGAAKRQVYAVAQAGDRSRVLRTDTYDPRSRPWYQAAAAQQRPVWSPVYNDFTSHEPTITLTKPVYRGDRIFAGVLATDVTLKVLTDFMRGLTVSEHGAAFVMDAEGYLIATSTQDIPFKTGGPVVERIHATDMLSPQLREAATQALAWRKGQQSGGVLVKASVLSSGDTEIAAARLGHQYGLDWITVVSVPRGDFMGGVARSIGQALLIGILCVAIALALGLSLLDRVLRDLRQLTMAAKKVGSGEPLPLLNIQRHDEIGQLAMSFSEMEHNLRIDKLTAVFNRASLIAQIAILRRQLEHRSGERPSFALLFIDLDHFKAINDHYGHDAGDKVLVTVASRLRESVRVTDVVARYGGDEFVILLKGVTDADDVIKTEQKIREAVETPVPLAHGTAQVGASIGWALFPEDGEDVDALLRIADVRMFDTKKRRKAAQS